MKKKLEMDICTYSSWYKLYTQYIHWCSLCDMYNRMTEGEGGRGMEKARLTAGQVQRSVINSFNIVCSQY